MYNVKTDYEYVDSTLKAETRESAGKKFYYIEVGGGGV